MLPLLEYKLSKCTVILDWQLLAWEVKDDSDCLFDEAEEIATKVQTV